MDDVSLTNGQMDEREFQAMVNADRSSDGTVGFTRAHSAEQEIIREGVRLGELGFAPGNVSFSKPARNKRRALLEAAKKAAPMLRGWSLTPLDDKLLVRYASFKEGYVCESCQGEGHTDETCTTCLGMKQYSRKEGWKREPCPDCVIVGSENQTPFSCGSKPCPECKGSGLAPGVLAIPDASKQDHSYGDIVAVGPDVEDLLPGDRVLFSKMAGIYIRGDFNVCELRRGEVMGYMRKA